MIGILPGRNATRQRLILGAGVVALASVLQLISIDLGQTFGSPWPIALLWAACGWSKLGPNLATSFLIFMLGCWVDLLTGSVLGTWAFAGLATLGLTIASIKYLGLSGMSSVVGCAVSGFFMLVIVAAIGVWQTQSFYLLGNIVSVGVAVVLYIPLRKLFEVSEEEA